MVHEYKASIAQSSCHTSPSRTKILHIHSKLQNTIQHGEKRFDEERELNSSCTSSGTETTRSSSSSSNTSQSSWLPSPSSIKTHLTSPISPALSTPRFWKYLIPSIPFTQEFDDLSMDLAMTKGVQNAVRSRPLLLGASPPIHVPRLKFPELFRSVCICDPKIKGNPIYLRSKFFTIGPRGLKIGACEFLNLPSNEVTDNCNLSCRLGPDQRPQFVLEYAASLIGHETCSVAFLVASQMDVTDIIRDLTAFSISSKRGQHDVAAEKGKDDKTPCQPMVRAGDTKHFSDSDSRGYEIDVDQHVRFRTSKHPRPRSKRFDTAVKMSTSPRYADKYYVSSGGKDPEDDLGGRCAPSFGRHPNAPFIYDASCSHQAPQLDWISIAAEESRGRDITTSLQDSTNQAAESGLSEAALVQLHVMIKSIRALHQECFTLSPAHRGDCWEISYSSSSVFNRADDVRIGFSRTDKDTLDMLGRYLGRDNPSPLSSRVRWGSDGVEKWLYCVPMMGARKARWMCFLTDREGFLGQ